MSIISPEQAIVILDGMDGTDPEMKHSLADDVLLAVVPDPVRQAYERLVERCAWWATA